MHSALAAVVGAVSLVGSGVARAADAPYQTVPNVAPTTLYYDAAAGSFVGGGSLTSLLYQQYNPGGAPRPVGPNPPPQPPPGIDKSFAIDDVHFAAPGTYHVTSFSFGLYVASNNAGQFSATVRAYGNDGSNSYLPEDIGGQSGKIYDLTMNGFSGAAGTYRVVVFNVDFYSTQHLWLGVSPASTHASIIIAGDATVELGSSDNLIAWQGYENHATYTPGLYTFAGGSVKADLTLEIGGTLEPAASFKWFGAFFHDGPGQIDLWSTPQHWRTLVGGNWVVAPTTPGENDTVSFEGGWPNIRLPGSAPLNLGASVNALDGIWNLYGLGGGQGHLRAGELNIGEVNGVVDPCYIVGDALDASRAATLTVTGPTRVRRGELIVTQASSAVLASLSVGSTVGGYNDPCFVVDAAATTVSSLSIAGGDVLVYRGGSFSNSGSTTIGTVLGGQNDPCYVVGDGANPASHGTAFMGSDVTLYTGELAVRNPGSTLTVGLPGNRKNLVIGDAGSPAQVTDPCFLVENQGAATISRQITLRRGDAVVRTGGLVTSTVGGSNPGVLIDGSNDPCYLVGDASGSGTLTAVGIVRVTKGELRLGHANSIITAGSLEVQAQGTIAGRGTVLLTGSGPVTISGALSPGEETSMGWGSVAGSLSFEDMPNLVLSGSSVTTIDLGAGRAVSDQVVSTADLTPGGTLVLRPIDGDVPAPGTVITIMQAQGALIPGEFAAVDDTLFLQVGRRATVEYAGDHVNAIVLCHADYDRNQFVNGDDFDSFVLDFELGLPAADYDGNTFVNGDDFDSFALDFQAGC